ncbi:hypothetical protein EDD99_0936 [Streptomyces sp. 846.5]|nr:hypothetical protein [Streptomyces sp. 846.5]TDU02537.1 hypothetical protein EDD99_0936 [Streptomyces sp. 846.5]
MPNRSDTSAKADCSGIGCILDAVRSGDDPRIDRLLSRFVESADLDALFALRAALSGCAPTAGIRRGQRRATCTSSAPQC